MILENVMVDQNVEPSVLGIPAGVAVVAVIEANALAGAEDLKAASVPAVAVVRSHEEIVNSAQAANTLTVSSSLRSRSLSEIRVVVIRGYCQVQEMHFSAGASMLACAGATAVISKYPSVRAKCGSGTC